VCIRCIVDGGDDDDDDDNNNNKYINLKLFYCVCMQYKELLRHELTREMKTDTPSRTLKIVIFKDHYIKCSSLCEENTRNIMEVDCYLVDTFFM